MAGVYKLSGLIRDSRTRAGVSGYRVTAFDVNNREEGGILGRAVTRANGVFVLNYDKEDFLRLVDEEASGGGPDVVVVIKNRFGKIVESTAPLVGAARFKEICVDVDVVLEDQRPSGPPILDPFEVLQIPYKTEIEILNAAGIKDRETLLEADLSVIADEAGVPVENLESFCLHAEMAHADTFTSEAALAIVSKTGIKTREHLAASQPTELMYAIHQAKEDGLIDAQLDFPSSVVYEWIGYAKGYELEPFATPMNVTRVLNNAKVITESVAEQNPNALITEVAKGLNSFSRLSAIANLQALMEDAGVTDLSALGTFSIQSDRTIYPGYYVARPALERELIAFDHSDLLTTMVERRSTRFDRIELFADCIRLVSEPVTDCVIFASLVKYIYDGRLVISKEVTSLTIIAEEILYSQLNDILYEDSELRPVPRAAWGERAATGTSYNRNVYTPGASERGRDGGRGSDGRNDSECGYDGNELGLAPNLTIYVKSTPEGLPNIRLRGHPGGTGQQGQYGGHGGDGARGRPAQAGFLWCVRGAGYGGDGGDGGKGGDGGTGGVGGSGGHCIVYTLDENIQVLNDIWNERMHLIDISGGPGGYGGPGGVGGDGGRGGDPGERDLPWCREEPDRTGANGRRGEHGESGLSGPDGESGSFELQPITVSDWEAVADMPWIVRLEPSYEAQCGDSVCVVAVNITSDTKVMFDHIQLEPTDVNLSSERLSFRVPDNMEGGMHYVSLKLMGTEGSYIYSETVGLRVLPHLASVSPDNGLPGTTINLMGDGFADNAQVRFADRTYEPSFASVRQIQFELPDHENIATDAGSKEVQVVNPDGRESETLYFDLTLDIVIRVKAWRVLPDLVWGNMDGTRRSEEEIRELFRDNPTPREVWIDHHILLLFDSDIGIAYAPADWANSWPSEPDRGELESHIMATDGQGQHLHFYDDAVNFYFVRNIDSSALAYTYLRANYVIFEDTPLYTDWEEAHIAAHELGHVFNLPHVCPNEDAGEEAGDTTFQRECVRSDRDFLMYPYTSVFHAEGNTLTATEAQIARHEASRRHNPLEVIELP